MDLTAGIRWKMFWCALITLGGALVALDILS
jgi:hypothetical protein